jgi:hypothetical protein
MPITFTNPGTIDPRLITTLGVNVKDTASAIGYFGTGLKYAIATLLREKQAIAIRSGGVEYTFAPRTEEVRGKAFQFIRMRAAGGLGAPTCIDLGFTTDLGRNWQLEQAYRELWSNCQDEGGTVLEHARPMPPEGHTDITVFGSDFDTVHRRRYAFLINPALPVLWSNDALQVLPGQNDRLFYRGIAVAKLHVPAGHTYNILAPLRLTEDRTVESDWSAQQIVGQALARCDVHTVVEDAFAQPHRWEQGISFSFMDCSEEFLNIIGDVYARKPLEVSKEVVQRYMRLRKARADRTAVPMAEWQRAALAEAQVWCANVGFPVAGYDTIMCASLGKDVLACAEHGTIYLTPECFLGGVLRRALLEEYVHLAHSVPDHSRAMQNVLFDQIVRLGEAVIAAKAPTTRRMPSPLGKVLNDKVPF